jgi:hypothetical protein
LEYLDGHLDDFLQIRRGREISGSAGQNHLSKQKIEKS